MITRWLAVLASVLAACLCPAQPSKAADRLAARVTVTPAARTISAPGTWVFTVRITNLTTHPLKELLVSEQVVLDGDPGHGGTEPFTSGRCGAALSTIYCPLPILEPGTSIPRHGSAFVPLALAPTAPSLIGRLARATFSLVDARLASTVSKRALPTARITPGALPRTGTPITPLVVLGLLSVVIGAVLLTRPGATVGSRKRATRSPGSRRTQA